jgi:beta-glucanase (GH16 family)
MKYVLHVLTIISLTALTAHARTWTSADGKSTFEGLLIQYDSDTGQVTVDREGKRFTFKQQMLSEDDIAFLKSDEAREWELVWADEFNVKGPPDKTKWDYEEGLVRNEEKQYYTRERKENVRVSDGVLVIEGRKEPFANPRGKQDSKNWREQSVAQYTSGSIHTLGKAEFQYGRIEVRAKVPQGKGMWPAIWTLGTNVGDVGWPRCGEMDIMEYVGKDQNTIHANNHFADPKNKENDLHKMAGGGKLKIEAPYADFHIYASEWTEKKITFFVDDKQYATFNIDTAGEGPDNPFRKPHYLLLNFAIGGSWGGPVDDSVFPRKYEIDYVRYYREKARPQKRSGGVKRVNP